MGDSGNQADFDNYTGKPHRRDWHPTAAAAKVRVGIPKPFFMSWYPQQPDEVLLTRATEEDYVSARHTHVVDRSKIIRPGELGSKPGWVKIGCTYVSTDLITELYWTSGLAPRWLQWLHDTFVKKEDTPV